MVLPHRPQRHAPWWRASSPSSRSGRSTAGPSDLKTIALFTCDNLFCQDNRKIALDLAAKAGYKIVADLTTKTGATTLASEVQRLQAANADVLFIVQYPAETEVFQADAKRAGYMPKVIATSNGSYSDQTWLKRRRRPTAPPAGSAATRRPSTWPAEAELEEGQRDLQEVQPRPGHGRAGDARDHRPPVDGRHINRAKSVDPAALQKAANETNMAPEQLIIDYKGIKFENGQNVAGHRRRDAGRLGRREAHALAVGPGRPVRLQADLPEPELAGARQQAEAKAS